MVTVVDAASMLKVVSSIEWLKDTGQEAGPGNHWLRLDFDRAVPVCVPYRLCTVPVCCVRVLYSWLGFEQAVLYVKGAEGRVAAMESVRHCSPPSPGESAAKEARMVDGNTSWFAHFSRISRRWALY